MFSPAVFNTGASFSEPCSIRTIPELIKYNAEQNPGHVFCIQALKPKDDGSSKPSMLQISHSQLKEAVLSCQSWLAGSIPELQTPYTDGDGNLGRGSPIALLMGSDVGLLFHLFALMGLGVPVVLLSARLSPEAIHGLLVQTSSVAIIASSTYQKSATQALSLFGTEKTTPSVYEPEPFETFMMHSSPSTHKVYQPNHYICDTDRKAIILHSSGTTGLPKAIWNSHRYLLEYSTCHDFEDEATAQALNVSTLPLYHGFGMVPVCLSLSIGKTVCFPVAKTIPTGRSTVELIKATNAKSVTSVPTILEQIHELEGGTEALKPLDFVACGGGPLKPSVGEAFAAAGVKFVNSYGITETGPLSVMYVPKPGYDWRFFRLRTDVGCSMRPTGQDGPNQSQRFRLSMTPAGWEETFEAQDDLLANPENPQYEFKPAGRVDDVLVLANGEKISPAILERQLSDRDDVRGALAFGDGQFQLGVIVEPSYPVELDQRDQYIQSIWPTIVEASVSMDSHGTVSSHQAVIVLPPGAELPRSDKGSVLRRQAYKSFQKEIDQVYEALEKEDASDSTDVTNVNTNGYPSPEQLESQIEKLVRGYLGLEEGHSTIGSNDDLFELGMNSLQALNLQRSLLAIITALEGRQGTIKVPRDFVYQHPSISKIVAALRKDIHHQNVGTSRGKRLQDITERHLATIFDDPVSCLHPKPGAVILLTGSTGGLGSQVLAQLTQQEGVRRIICLNRPNGKDPLTQQLEANRTKCISDSEKLSPKVSLIQTSTDGTMLGLSAPEYSELCTEVTHVLHNAWPMDLNRTVASFEPPLKTMSNILKLLKDIKYVRPHVHPRLHFVSSIAVVGNYPYVHGSRIVPEVPIHDDQSTLEFGYAEAKLVCERLVEMAQADSKEFELAIIRVGQISGGNNGYWSVNEHFPAFVKASQLIGALPAIHGTASWLPVESAAATMCDLLLSPSPSRQLVYHVENPIRESYHDILFSLQKQLGLEATLLISYEDWLQKLRDFPEDAGDIAPAKKLLDFFEHDFIHMATGKVILDTSASRAVSATLREMDGVSDKVLEASVKYWKAVGFL